MYNLFILFRVGKCSKDENQNVPTSTLKLRVVGVLFLGNEFMFCYHHLDRQEERRLIMITSSPSVVWPHWPTSHWGKLSNTGTSQ